MATSWYSYGIRCLYPFVSLAMTASVSQAQQVFSQPMQPGAEQPTVSVPPMVTVPQTTTPGASPAYPGETVFQAPNNYQRGTAGRYLVYVNGASPYLLQQVQTVEPKAFIQQYQGRQVIQVGTFGDETNARRQLEALRGQGVMAELATTPSSSYPYLPASVASTPNPYPSSGAGTLPNPYPPTGTPDSNPYPQSGPIGAPGGSYPPSGVMDTNAYPPNGAMNPLNSYPPNAYPPPPPSGDASSYSYPPNNSGVSRSTPYLVIVPGGREELPMLTQRAMGLGIRQDAIQQKDSPLGPHLEIGPFSAYKEAKDVSNYLSGSGLDSRVYFSR